MKIYTASSWKNEQIIKPLVLLLREWGHEVYSFIEQKEHRNIWEPIIWERCNGIQCLAYAKSREAFSLDNYRLDWADVCILINPSGRDSHLEAGYMKGKGRLLVIYSMWPIGEFSNMYHFADLFISPETLGDLKNWLAKKDAQYAW